MLHLVKTKKTKRKFYNKWCYKVSLLMYGSVVFRMTTLDNIEDWLEKEPRYRYLQEAAKNKDNILGLTETLSAYDKSLWQIRVERDQLDFYTNDVSIYDEISNRFLHIIKQRFKPSDDLPLLDNNKIIANILPHGRYKYKVYLLPHKFNKDRESKFSFLQWLDTQTPRVSISKSVKAWFMNTDWNWDRRYMWVEDEPTLLLLKLRNSEVCGKVYEYQLCDK